MSRKIENKNIFNFIFCKSAGCFDNLKNSARHTIH